MRKLLIASVLILNCVMAGAFEIRGMHIDLRAEVMTMPALKALAEKAAAGGINTIIMEWEATFPFQENATICNAEAYTQEEVKDFIGFCSSLGIEVIPLQNCFGHCDYILRHERYAALRESGKDFSQVCPLKESLAKEVFTSIFSEIARMHPSKYIHIGADETRLLGVCTNCARKVQEEGRSKLFCDYVLQMCEIVKGLGKTPIIWADILTKFPDAAASLPDDLIVADWNYGWDLNKFGDFKAMVDLGFPMWGSPSLRSSPDDIHTTCWMKHLNNLKDYVGTIRELGFKGAIETSWSTSGQYGMTREASGEAIDIQPIRFVYPLSGFDLLQSAFCEAVSSDKPFEPEAFVREYASEKFGFGPDGQQLLWDYVNMPQNRITPRTYGIVPEELKACRDMKERLNSAKVKRSGKQDFAHLGMMLDIRINYLEFQSLMAEYESPSYKTESKAELAPRARKIMKDCEKCRRRFKRLNKDYLKNPLKAYDEYGYYGRLKNVCAALSN